jgi:predicted PurR-regulated permease PerM
VRAPWLAGGAAALVVLFLFRNLLLPLFLAAALAYLLNPLVKWVESREIRRSVAVAAVYIGALLILVLGTYVVGPRLRAELSALADRLPIMTGEVERAVTRAADELAAAVPATRRFLPGETTGPGWLERQLEGRAVRAAELFEHAGHIFLYAILIPFFAFFVLRDTHRVIGYCMDRLPPAHVETSVAVWCEIDGIIGRYLRGVALDGLVIGVLASVGLWAIGVPYPLLLGVVAGLANTIPFVGPLLSAAVAGLAVLTQGQGLAGVGRVVAFFLVLKVVDDTVIQPLTIGRSVHLHPMLLLASVVAGNQAFGILGMVVAVPTVTALQETTRLLLEHRRVLASHREPTAPSGCVV